MSISKNISNTFVKLGFVLALLAVVSFCFVGCGGLSTLRENPASDATVYGNGGLAVQKGDYVYFVNGYINTSDVADTNHFGKIDHSAIYRAKLTDGKVVETNVETDEDGEKIVDKTQSINDLEIIVPKVAGFEYSNLYIFGDYIYYSTPNNLKDRKGEVQSTHLHFYRARLDRAGGNDLLYSTDAENTEVSVTMYSIGDEVYQVIKDGEKLVLNTIKGKSVTVKTISEDAHEASLPVYQNSTDVVRDIDKKIYFTEHTDTGSALKAFDLASKETEEIFNQAGIEYEIINTNGDYLYYVKTNSVPPAFSGKIYAMDKNNNEILVSNQAVTDDIKEYHLAGTNTGASVIYTDGTSTYFKRSTDASGTLVLSADVISEIVDVQGNFMYYIKDSNLYKINYTLANQTAELVLPEGTTPKTDSTANIDIDNKKIFYFVKYTNNYYLHFINFEATDEDENTYTHFIGKLMEEDYLETSEE